MKISGTGATPPPPDETPSAKPGRADGAATTFAQQLDGSAPAAGAAPTSAPQGAGAVGAMDRAAAVDPVRAVAADLRAGRIDPEQAVDRLLEETLTRRVGARAPEAVRARLRASLVDLLTHDPHLADLVKRLERGR